MWGVGCGVWGVGCGVWGVGCGVWGVDLVREAPLGAPGSDGMVITTCQKCEFQTQLWRARHAPSTSSNS